MNNKIKNWFKSIFVSVDGVEPKLLQLTKKNSFHSVISSVLSILIGLFIGSLLVVIVGLASDDIPTGHIGRAIGLIFLGIFTEVNYGITSIGFNAVYIGDMLPSGNGYYIRVVGNDVKTVHIG